MKGLKNYAAIKAPCMADIIWMIPIDHFAVDQRIGYLAGIRYLH